MQRFLVFGVGVSLWLLLPACVPTGEGNWQPIPIDGGSQPAPQPALVKPTVKPTIAPTLMPIAEDEVNIPGVREVHAVANRGDCQKMAQRFRQQGRNLRLARIKPSRDKILKYICIFEGADAGIDIFENNRSK